MLIKRLLLGLILLWSVLFGPWWLTVVVAVLGFIFYCNYYEGLGAALAIDLLYGGSEAVLWGLPLFLTLAGVVSLLILPPLRYRLLWS